MTSPAHGAVATQREATYSRQPPPLPPRLKPAHGARPTSNNSSLIAMSSHDPRSSSTQSLVPDPAVDSSNLRRVLLVYLHGFMGNETSFRSFPAHVHNLVTVTLADTHVVHTKLYPRYQSRNTLEHARDNFSNWLAPHEDQWTDVILLGHSMGGLLAADIALVFRHRIVGVINFDVPFLGMHPGIIKAGLGSLFSPAPAPVDEIAEEPSEKKPSRMATFFNPQPNDPNFNPTFENDVRLPVRKGWENTLHWLNKHYANGLRQATKGLVKSHFEFGSAMADYKELKDRYARVRALEEEDEKTRKSANPGVASPPRIRFVNYYTVSTGRPKKPKSPKSQSPSRPSSRTSQSRDREAETMASASRPAVASIRSQSIMNSARISVEVQEHHGNEILPVTPQEPLSATSPIRSFSAEGTPYHTDSAPNLAEIPPIPQEPPFVDLLQFTDKHERKAAEKEHDKALKEYQRAVKARNKAIKERTKSEEKWAKQQEQQRKKDCEQEEFKNSHQYKEEQRLKQEEERMRKEHERMNGGPPKPDEDPGASSNTHQQEQKQRFNKESDSTEDSFPTTDMDLGYEMSPEEAPAIQTLDEDIGAMDLGDNQHQHQSSNHPYGNYDFSRSAILNQAPPDDHSSMHESNYTLATTDSNASHPPTPGEDGEPKEKKKKLGKFCMLPPKDSAGNVDPTWVRVFMKNMDEVTAHTSLFFVNETYERLVGDVGARIEEWIREADSMRVARELNMQG